VSPPLADVGLATLAFASTNVDDIFLLLAFFADASYSPRRVVAGQYVGIAALVVASFAASLFAARLPEVFLRALGVLPIVLGLLRAWELRRASPDGTGTASRGGVVGVALATVASGGDNVAVYVPVFSTHMGRILVYVVVFAVMTAVWCWVAYAIVRAPLVGRHIRRWGRYAVPVVLLLLGILILFGA
jgi:cadmium resistance protein CadD (predicted permease)